jgi:EpsI family protein
MKSYKFLIVLTVLGLSIVASYSLPKAKYVGTGFISQLDIPDSFGNWRGRDVSNEVGLRNLSATTYNFVGEAYAYKFVNNSGQSLLFVILDAGNFHHPKVCFTGAGFEIKELDDTTFTVANRNLKTHTLFTTKGKDSYLSFYWIVIDKNIAHEWIEQKFKQLYFSLFGTQRVGLMVRIDVPAKENDLEKAAVMAKSFISDIIGQLPVEKTEYIFGSR